MFQPDLFALEKPVDGHSTTLKPTVGTGSAARRRWAVSTNGMTGSMKVSDEVVRGESLDLPAVLDLLAGVSPRPRYTFMVLNLIARAAGKSDSAGPYVREAGEAIPVRDWLSDAMMPMAQRDSRRLAVVAQVREDLKAAGQLPASEDAAEVMVAEEVRRRLRHSGRSNVSRAVSDLVRAGLVRRHYQGYRVDHPNRGAQREAVYTIMPAAKRALGRTA